MKTRTIPKDVYPWWTCKINHKEYRFPAGATVSVPDAVAALIDEINAAKKQPENEYIPHLPDITPADEGKVLTVRSGRIVAEETQTPEPPDLSPLEVSATVGEDAYGRSTATFDKTAGQLYNAANAGKMMRITVLDVPVGEDETEDFIFLQPIDIIKAIATDGVDYIVKAHLDAGSSDAVFYGSGLSADDPVVVTMYQGE